MEFASSPYKILALLLVLGTKKQQSVQNMYFYIIKRKFWIEFTSGKMV